MLLSKTAVMIGLQVKANWCWKKIQNTTVTTHHERELLILITVSDVFF